MDTVKTTTAQGGDEAEPAGAAAGGGGGAGAAALGAPPSGDWLLEMLVGAANRQPGLAFDLTLNVRGTVVTGTLIGAKEFFEEYGRAMALAGLPRLEEDFRAVGEELQRALSDLPEGAGPAVPPPHFVHLRDARMLTGPGLVPTNRGVLWRGHLSSVDGFSVGVLAPPPPLSLGVGDPEAGDPEA